jgi:type IV secretion system protein VirD4
VTGTPGGVVVTGTATDLYELTAPLRRVRGPVHVFNPGGTGSLASTLCWSPLSGCADPRTAARRADALMGPPAGREDGRWAREVLTVWLHAAALGWYRMRDVAGWVARPGADKGEILAALDASPQATGMRRAAERIIDAPSRTRDEVMAAIAPALAWTTLPAATAGDPDPGEVPFDVTDLADRRGTLYLLGDDSGVTAPLAGALVAEVAHQARAVAATRPRGRFDPALSMVLDEVTLFCPGPLDGWMAELSTKRSIVIHAAARGQEQLKQRWGRDGTSRILACAAELLVYRGVS